MSEKLTGEDVVQAMIHHADTVRDAIMQILRQMEVPPELDDRNVYQAIAMAGLELAARSAAVLSALSRSEFINAAETLYDNADREKSRWGLA
jgi:hypothetical protein